MKIKRIPIKRLETADYNPRQDLKPDDPRYKALVKSMDEFGLVQPLVFNERTKTLIGGHQRLKVMKARGETHADTVLVDLSLEQEKALNLALNKVSGGWDKDKLALVLDDLIAIPELDLGITGFEMPEVEELLASVVDQASGNDEFDVEAELENSSPAITKPGELIHLGLHDEHRLMCGDATNPAHLAKLLGDRRAMMVHADPPYGVRYDSQKRVTDKALKKRKPHPRTGRLQNDDLTPKKYAKWFGKVVDQMSEAMAPGAPFYIWNGNKNFGLMSELLRAQGHHVSTILTWAKESAALGFGDYSEQTEFCLYGWKRGARRPWYGPKNETTLWRMNRDRVKDYQHPTQKALALAERAIRNSSQLGDLVLDPFLGSGTTLIASALMGRECYGLEIDPRYCDIIVKRYIALAGEGAVAPEIASRFMPGRN